jgi:type I restriction enzyme S subunit
MTLQTLPKYATYKDSGIEWLGKIPAHWKVKKLKFSTLINKESLPENTQRNHVLEYVDIGSVTFENGIEKAEDFSFGDAPSRARRLAKNGDTIVSTVRTYLKAIAFIDERYEKCVYSTGFAVITPKEDFSPKFLTNFIRSNAFTHQVDDVAKGMSYPAINSTDLSNLYIVDAPFSEQTAIAHFLDQKTAQIDAAIAIKEQQIALLKERKQILIQHAVTQGLDPTVPMKDSGVEWIREIPAHWEVVKLKYLFKEINDRTDTGVETLLSLRMDVGLVPHDDVSDKPISDLELIGYKKVCPGQIVMNRMRAAIGIFGIPSVHGLVSPDYAVFNSTKDIHLEYFLLLFKTPLLGTQFRLSSKGLGTGSSGFMRLYFESFGDIKIPFCSKRDQVKIFSWIESESEKINSSIGFIAQQIEKLREYKTTLINSAVTGKIRVTSEMAAAVRSP